MTSFAVRHVSVTIERSPAEVHAFASNPENLPRWAKGLSGASIQRDGDAWLADSPMGKVRVRFVAANPYGILDHDVTLLASGESFHNPMRVVPNGDGAELIFSVFRRTGASNADFEADVAAVTRDLHALKALLER